jgi:hypothetical protein
MSLFTPTNDIAISLTSRILPDALATGMYLSQVYNTAALMDPVKILMKLRVFKNISLSSNNDEYSLETRSIE